MRITTLCFIVNEIKQYYYWNRIMFECQLWWAIFHAHASIISNIITLNRFAVGGSDAGGKSRWLFTNSRSRSAKRARSQPADATATSRRNQWPVNCEKSEAVFGFTRDTRVRVRYTITIIYYLIIRAGCKIFVDIIHTNNNCVNGVIIIWIYFFFVS